MKGTNNFFITTPKVSPKYGGKRGQAGAGGHEDSQSKRKRFFFRILCDLRNGSFFAFSGNSILNETIFKPNLRAIISIDFHTVNKSKPL
jgi:hypothetical protein